MTQLPATPSGRFPLAPTVHEYELMRGNIVADPAEAESILRHYWRIFYKRRWIVLAAVALCVAVALLFTLISQRKYTSTVTLEVNREAPKVVDIQEVDQSAEAGPSLEFYQTQYALLKSRSLSQSVVRDLNLANNFPYLAHYRQRGVDDLRAKNLEERIDLATDMVNKDTSVSPVRGSSIISVGFTSPDPVLSAEVANSIAQNFIQSSLSRRYEAAAYARDFLQSRLKQVRAKLEDSERKAVQYAQQQGLIRIHTGGGDSGSDQSLLASQLSELSTQLTSAHAQRAQAEAQFSQGSSGSAAAQSLSSTTLSTLRPQRAELVAQLTKLQADFGPAYPPVIALKSQIQELDRQIAREESRVNSSVRQDLGGRYRQALATEMALQEKVDGLKAQLIGEEGRSIRFNILQRDVDTNRGLYEALLQRFKEVGIAGGVGTNNVAIVDSARPPDGPSSPNLPLNLALGLLLGAIIGTALAISLEQLAESIVLPSEFQTRLRVPLLGSTPAIGKRPAALRLLPKPVSTTEAPSVVNAEEDQNANSSLTEAYMSIVTALRFSTEHGAPKSIAVTSSREQEGKSTTTIAIARILSSTGARILVIDGDMRRPTMHRAFGLNARTGLSDVLSGQTRWEGAVQETGETRLFVMAAGKTPPSPAALLATRTFATLIKEACAQFDHVVVDCPPLLGIADAPLVAAAVEGTIFVMEAGRTRASQAHHALDRLAAVQSNIIGAILTKLDSQASGYGYGYSYTYNYGGK